MPSYSSLSAYYQENEQQSIRICGERKTHCFWECKSEGHYGHEYGGSKKNKSRGMANEKNLLKNRTTTPEAFLGICPKALSQQAQ